MQSILIYLGVLGIARVTQGGRCGCGLQLVLLLLQLEALQGAGSDLEHVGALEHEGQALVEVHGGQLGSGRFAEGGGIGPVRSHAAVQTATSGVKAFLSATRCCCCCTLRLCGGGGSLGIVVACAYNTKVKPIQVIYMK